MARLLDAASPQHLAALQLDEQKFGNRAALASGGEARGRGRGPCLRPGSCLSTTIARLNFAWSPGGYGGVPMLYFKRMLAGEPIANPSGGAGAVLPSAQRRPGRSPGCGAAKSSAPHMNWGGGDTVGITDCIRFMEELTGVEASLVIQHGYQRDLPVRPHPALGADRTLHG